MNKTNKQRSDRKHAQCGLEEEVTWCDLFTEEHKGRGLDPTRSWRCPGWKKVPHQVTTLTLPRTERVYSPLRLDLETLKGSEMGTVETSD